VRDAVVQQQAAGAADDKALTAALMLAVTTFISGVFTRFVVGDHAIADAQQLERLLRAIVDAVARDYRA
jgi:hypothetical protein